MFVNRMMNDPEFAARIRKQQEEAAIEASFGGNPFGQYVKKDELTPADAERYLAEDARREAEEAPPPISKEEDEALKMVAGREGEVKVVAQSLAFVGVGAGAKRDGGLTAVDDDGGTTASAICAMLNGAYGDEERGPEAFREGAMVDARATKGCFNVTSTRVFSDRWYQQNHSPYENLRRDDHLGPNHMSL